MKYALRLSKNTIKPIFTLQIDIGLAGKLNLSNISQLAELQPKIVGFRSAVCEDENRKKTHSQ